MSRFLRTIGLVILAGFVISAGTAVSQPLHAELIRTGYGLVGDTLYGGSVILQGFVKGHSASLSILEPNPDAVHQFFRTPYGDTEPDVETGWLSSPTVDIDGGGDGVIYIYTAAAKAGTDSVESRNELWLMHDWYRPDRVGVHHIAYGAGAPTPHIELRWSRGTDSASGVYYYLIYRALNEWELSYIDDYMFPIDTVWETGAPGYTYRDYSVSAGDRYFYKIVPVDKAGWIRRSENNTIIGRAQAEPTTPPCSYLRTLPRYHMGSGITVRIDDDLCPGRPDVEYQYRKTVVEFVDGVPTIDTTISEFSEWTMSRSYFWNTDTCQTYAFSARVSEIGTYTHEWTDLTSFRVMSTNDNRPPDCPDSMSATSLGEDGILVQFTHYPENDCGSGTMGYYLFRVPDTDWGDVLDEGTDPSIGWEDALMGYILHEYPVHPTNPHYQFQDDGPTDSLIDLEDNACYYYVVCPFDSAGNVSWFICPYIGGQIDTACVDKGVGAPWPVTLDFPEYVTDSIVVMFIDTTFCDAEEVVIEWARSADFSIGYNTTGPLPIMDPADGPPVWSYENLGSPACSDWDTLKFTLYSAHENTYYFRAKFIDGNLNHSEWGVPTLSTTFDNTPPTTVGIKYMHSIATDVDEVKIRITWHADSITDAGIGLQGIKIYRSDAVGVLGTEIADLAPTVNEYYDMSPVPDNNWHDNVYKVVPYDALGHHNTTGAQGFFPTLSGPFGMDFHPPLVPVVDTVLVSPYLDSFTVYWTDPGPGHISNRYTMRHSASLTGLWSPDPLLRVEVNVGSGLSATFPIEDLIGGTRHFFTMHSRDTRTPTNHSGWSSVFEYRIPEIIMTSFTVHCASGWNLVSLPVIPGNTNRHVLFPGNEGVFQWNHFAGEYETVDNLEAGKAYWMLIPVPTDYLVTGIPITRIEETMSERGWWTVGAAYDTVPMGYTFSDVSYLWGWDATIAEYTEVDGLESGNGYWLLAHGDGDFYSEPGMAVTKFAPEGLFIDWELLIAAGDNTLSIGHSPYSEIGLDRLDKPLPPPSPYGEAGAFLFEEDDFTYSRSIRPDGEWIIALPRLTDLSWDPNSVPLEGLTLIADGKSIDMRTVGYASAIGNAKIVAGDALPKDFALDPVFPNPFNPTCEIPFSLPEASDVSIEIYDLTGRQVAKLVDSEFSAGRHNVKWHGVDETGREMPGGLYLCRMTAGSFVETRRMLLLK